MAGNQDRATIERRLEQTPGGHLVIVHYTPSHPVYREWVYNRGDIEHTKVIWARDLGQECNEKLIGAYEGRSVWLIEPDINPAELRPYSAPALSAASQIAVSMIPATDGLGVNPALQTSSSNLD